MPGPAIPGVQLADGGGGSASPVPPTHTPQADAVYCDGKREGEASNAARASDPGPGRFALSGAGGTAGAFFLRHQLLPGGPGLRLRLGLGRGLRAPLRPVHGPGRTWGRGRTRTALLSPGPGARLGGNVRGARGQAGRQEGRWQRRGRPGRLERCALTAPCVREGEGKVEVGRRKEGARRDAAAAASSRSRRRQRTSV